ncbi:DNA replication and repair protein RecF [uncultured Alistipes sp.]|uniref:DNA replication/repair protein RecF n=1 Tax=uncultured Alistipes sp. TaxID=538949 RepID=UPI00261CC97D|nr:DNA replication and repair protein RecF [uncultured Alistipes sp.]
MLLKKLSLINFKNIEQEELAPVAGINCFVGDNGAGKTNVLDAVYYLSMCKSALAMTDAQCIRHGEEFFVLDARYAADGGREEGVVCSFSRKGGKVLKRNGKEYDRLADHVGLVPAAIVSPADSALISDAADERRRYLNAFISQLDRAYLAAVMRYNAVLAERNRLLKTMSPDETMLEIYDRQLAEHGTAIHARRRQAVAELEPLVASYYRALCSDRETVELIYKSELNDRPFGDLLVAARQRDLVNQFTTAGIHRDDLVLRIGGYPLRKYGSQGQQKSFLIALKLAQYAVVAARGEKPILLLDDLFDKLDAGRVEQLLRLVADDAFGQIFITDCNPTRLRRILDRAGGDYALFTVAGGRIARAADVPGRRTDGPPTEADDETAVPESASSDNPRAARAENVRTTEDESRNAPPEKAERTTGAGTPETTRETDGDAEHGRTTAGPDRKGGGA